MLAWMKFFNKTSTSVVFLLGFTLFASFPAASIEANTPMPDCVLESLSGPVQSSLKQSLGKVIYLDFWASWCGPCLQSMPFMESLYASHKNKGLEIIAVNLDDNREDAQQFLSAHPVSFPVVTNKDGLCAGAYNVEAMPSSFLIDRKGHVRHVQAGFHLSERDEIKAKLEHLLHEK